MTELLLTLLIIVVVLNMVVRLVTIYRKKKEKKVFTCSKDIEDYWIGRVISAKYGYSTIRGKIIFMSHKSIHVKNIDWPSIDYNLTDKHLQGPGEFLQDYQRYLNFLEYENKLLEYESKALEEIDEVKLNY